MAQRGRKASAALSVISRVDGRPARLEPPASLTESEREAFIQVVSACDSRHFVPSDLPLLASYARAICLEERASRELREQGDVVDGRASAWLTVWEKAHRGMVALSLRLRLSPQGRAQHAKAPEAQPSYYDVMRMAGYDKS
jgi:hypothetical protein